MTKLPAKELIAPIKTNQAQENQVLINQVVNLMANQMMTKLTVFHLIVRMINQMVINPVQEIQTVSTKSKFY